MVPAGNKTKRLSSVNHTTRTIHHHHHQTSMMKLFRENSEQLLFFNYFQKEAPSWVFDRALD